MNQLTILCNPNVATLHVRKTANSAAVDDGPDADARADGDIRKRLDIGAVGIHTVGLSILVSFAYEGGSFTLAGSLFLMPIVI